MSKPTSRQPKTTAPKLSAKPAAGSLVVVRKAAQKPVHATRAAIRRAVRSVAGERAAADA